MRMSYEWPLEDDVTKDLRKKTRAPSNGDDREPLDRLERLGLMAAISAGLAHDLNSPLAALSLQLHAFAKQLHLVEQLTGADGAMFHACRSSLVALEETSDFMQRLVADFVRFSGGGGMGRGVTSVRAAAEAAVRLTRSLVCDRATVEIAIPRDLCATVEETTVIRAVMHLMLNASEAFPTASPLKNRIRVNGARIEDGIGLDVSDNGGGVPPEILPRLFQPFTTSKRRGLGLGLVVGRSLLRQSGGDLELLDSGPDGTTFRCLLPEARFDGNG
jgi:two-component system, NtrC family, C4-dicarboxylate transport sensor histidine kinase DctB